MALSALPAEILSRICRFIILKDPPSKSKLPQDVKSLRLSCREIYQKTLFDAGIVYGGMLDQLVVKLTYKSLGVLLSISSIPYFRDRLREVTLYWPYGSFQYGSTRLSISEKEYNSKCEELEAFATSPDAIYILTESFKNLAKSTSLLKVHLPEEATYPAVFKALTCASFTRPIVHVVINPANFRQSFQERFLHPLSESPHLISYVTFIATPHLESEDRESDTVTYDVAHNEHGRHYSGYKSVTPALSKLAVKLYSVREIGLYGCDIAPRLRLCHGCEDIWVNLFSNDTYPHITHLRLYNSYVSGSRLRRFIKRHSGTLQRIEFGFVVLTDGTWRSVAQGLQKCPNLDCLHMGLDTTTGRYISSLRQKHAAPPLMVSLPEEYITPGPDHLPEASIGIWKFNVVMSNRNDVVHWLDVFVQYFATIKSDAEDYDWDDGYKFPASHEACTFLLPNQKLSVPDCRSRSRVAMNRYLEVAEDA